MRILKAYKLTADLTQEQLAKKLELSVSMVSLLLRGKREPSLDTVRKIAALTSVSVNVICADLDRLRRQRAPTAQDLEQIAQVMK